MNKNIKKINSLYDFQFNHINWNFKCVNKCPCKSPLVSCPKALLNELFFIHDGSICLCNPSAIRY